MADVELSQHPATVGNGAANVGGSLPNHLREVASLHAEDGVVPIVKLAFLPPHVDNCRNFMTAGINGQILSVFANRL